MNDCPLPEVPGLHRHIVTLDERDLLRVSGPFAIAIDSLNAAGVDAVLIYHALQYQLGLTTKLMSIVPHLEASVRDAFPAFVAGYNRASSCHDH